MSDKLTGVILAAGRGNRIQPLNLLRPKPLLPVANKPIMQYQIEAMRGLGISDIVLVVGYLQEEVRRYFGEGEALGVRLHYAEQREAIGIAHAVGLLEDEIHTPFLLCLGDIFMEADDLGSMVRIFNERQAGAVLAVKREPVPEFIRRNFAVVTRPDGTVERVIEKPRHLVNDLKGCGIYLFSLAIFDAIRRTPRTAQRDEYEITNAIQILIDDGYPVYPAEVITWDMNITIARDLLECNCRQLARLGQNVLAGAGAEIHPGAKLKNVVVGNRARITAPVELCDCLVLDEVCLATPGRHERAIFTADAVLDCL